MAGTVTIEFESSQTADGQTQVFTVDLSPVHMVEDTYSKSPEIDGLEQEPDEGTDPVTFIFDTKKTVHRFVITGVLVKTDDDMTNGVIRLEQSGSINDWESKIGRLRILYGYGGALDTRLRFNYNGVEYLGYMTRLTMNRAGGEDFYEYIIEIIEGVPEDEI